MGDGRKDDDTTIKVASKKEVKNGSIKLKKAAPKVKQPGNWKDLSIVENEKKSKAAAAAAAAAHAASPGPVVNELDGKNLITFATGRPLEDAPDMQTCKHCRKLILTAAAVEHIAGCLKVKKEKAQKKKEAREKRERAKELAREEEARKADEDGDGRADDGSDGDDDGEKKGVNGGKTTKKAAGKKTEISQGKKRKADTELDKGPKAKKKKDEPKPKMVKPKGPVDVERQCGVIMPNGQPCARSLTCKSHSMGAKRAVAGRSLPYDMLLAAYQKKNQAKQQKAAIDANAPLEDDDDPNAGPVDSDEETAAVMIALSHWNPQPVVSQPVYLPIKRQYQLARLRDQLETATNGGRVNIFKVVGYGAQRLPEGHPGLYDIEDAPGEPDPSMLGNFSRRSSTFSATGAPQRRPSVTSRA